MAHSDLPHRHCPIYNSVMEDPYLVVGFCLDRVMCFKIWGVFDDSGGPFYCWFLCLGISGILSYVIYGVDSVMFFCCFRIVFVESIFFWYEINVKLQFVWYILCKLKLRKKYFWSNTKTWGSKVRTAWIEALNPY